MTFRTKLLVALLFVGVAPALVTSALSFRANREELIATVGGAQRDVVSEAANFSERSVQQSVEDLRRAVAYLPFAELGRDQLQSVLSIPFRQMPALEALAVLDADGNAVIPPLVREGDRPGQLGAFAEHIPFKAALQDGVAIGAPWSRATDAAPALAVAVRIDAPEGSQPASGARVLAAEVTLASLVRRVNELAQPDRFAEIVGADGTVIARASGPSAHGAPADEALQELVAQLQRGKAAQVRLLQRPGQPEWLSAAAPFPQLGWTLIVAQPGEVALGAADRVARYVVYWAAIALALTFALGLFMARGISRPVQALSGAADALRGGDYGRRAPVESRDELGRLATTFNAMADEIARRDKEIRGFNEELQQRVEQKTAELNQARDQIERSRRLEGLVSMGAGLAHEMNNPLTSVLGILALIREEADAGSANAELLQVAEKDAERIADIVERFRRMVERDVAEAIRFDVGASIRAALESCAPELDPKRFKVETSLPDAPLYANGEPRQLTEAIVQLLRNAAQAMPGGGALTVRLTAPEQGALRITISDTGHGIPAELRERVFDPFFTTRRQAGRLGLGLTVVHRVVHAHHGRILLDSAAGAGTTFTVILPAATGGAHLR